MVEGTFTVKPYARKNPSGARGQRGAKKRQADLAITAEMYAKGKSLQYIADMVGVSVPQVSYDMKLIREVWVERTREAAEVIIARELAKIDLVEKNWWEAWERSIGKKTKTRTKSVPTNETIEVGEDGQVVVERVFEVETVEGNPEYLKGVERCIQQRCKLIGIMPPDKVANTLPDGSPAPPPVTAISVHYVLPGKEE